MADINHETTGKAARKGLMGAGLAAVAASVCCIGPLVLLGLGAGGVWAGGFSFFEPIRSYLIVLSLGLLAYSFHRSYRKTAAEDCEPGMVCANPEVDRFTKLSLWSVTILVLGLLSVPYLVPSLYAQQSESQDPGSSGKEVELLVSGMTCSSCELTYEKFVSSVDGVIGVEADYATRSAIVRYDSTVISLDQVLKETKKTGYGSNLLEKKASDHR